MKSVTSCDPINPYTQNETFGVPYNGGYKPDPTLEWIPADSNVIDSKDDFISPTIMPPSNVYFKTCEARRVDPRVGGIPTFQMEYDDFTESQTIIQVPPPPAAPASSEPLYERSDLQWKILIALAVILTVLLFISRY